MEDRRERHEDIIVKKVETTLLSLGIVDKRQGIRTMIQPCLPCVPCVGHGIVQAVGHSIHTG